MKQASLDLSLFRWIESQTSETDRLALLSIKEAICSVAETYRYLEVGSHLGGSLQPHIVDPRCVAIFSVDPRPLEQADERWSSNYKYDGNSTQRMLTLLASIPDANMSKIQTFETSSWELTPNSISSPVDFAFIDGEHTNDAAFRDFSSVRRFLAPMAILAFHDCSVIAGALLKISHSISRESQSTCFKYFPRSNVVALSFGSRLLSQSLVDYGWRDGLPRPTWNRLKLMVRRRFPRIYSVLYACNRYCLARE
jgi:Methyltransferase domain